MYGKMKRIVALLICLCLLTSAAYAESILPGLKMTDKILYAPALRVEIRSTVGAVDAMIGGMLLGYEKEKDMARAFRYGIAAGAASIMTEGTQLIVREDFSRLLDMVKIQEV